MQTSQVDIKVEETGFKEAAAGWIIDQRFVSAVGHNLKKVLNLGRYMLGGGALKWISHTGFVTCGDANPSQVFISSLSRLKVSADLHFSNACGVLSVRLFEVR